MNLILNTDSYKASHYLQYPPGTETVYSYIEARGSEDESIKETVFFGLQMFLKEYLTKPITREDIEEAKSVFELHGEPFNQDDWNYILDKHDGYLPLEISAVPEGSIVGLNNALVQVRNTDPRVPWLTSYVETMLLRAIWYPVTVATNSRYIKRDLLAYAKKSGSSLEGVEFKLHDFGARGVSSYESSMIGGLAHLVNFKGTDTVSAILAGRKYYNEPMAGFSIPAAEHSTITVWGSDSEVDAYRNMLKRFASPGSLVAVVSDSYDIYHAAKYLWGRELKKQVIESGATVVVRPDSGDPTRVPIEVIETLMEEYGYTTNERGYRTLPECIRVIQGDGINRKSIQDILANLDSSKLSLDSISFGMGGALLQQVNRDTFKFAMKACYAIVNGEGRDVSKRPVTSRMKSSKAGVLVLNKDEDDDFITNRRENSVGDDYLEVVYRNGRVVRESTFESIRSRVNSF